jgi:hypothetical protein
MTGGTYRGLALVTRETNILVLVAAIEGSDELLKNIAEKALGIDWERVAEGCRVVEVEVSERMN